jgi:hypothetical protein
MCKFYWKLLEIDLYIFKDSNEGIGIIIIIIGIALQVKKVKILIPSMPCDDNYLWILFKIQNNEKHHQNFMP